MKAATSASAPGVPVQYREYGGSGSGEGERKMFIITWWLGPAAQAKEAQWVRAPAAARPGDTDTGWGDSSAPRARRPAHLD